MLEIGIANICPPVECVPTEIQAFRFTYESIADERNFQPVSIKQPKRFNDKSDLEKCSGFGISLFQTEEFAINRYNKLKKTSPQIEKTIGSYLATGKINNNDGVITPINESGHFDLHESDICNLHDRFSIIKKIA